jgi:ribosome-binding factor A
MPSNRRYSRLDRVNEALREVVADELELVDDERLELVTVTGARVDPDLRHALVWYSAMSAPAADDEVEAALVRHRVRLQAAVARQLRLKRTPELAFKPDPAIAVGSRVEEIIRGLDRGPGEPMSDVEKPAAREDRQ